ncbi:3420_t:CDS:2, partial [Racocetra persica]
TVPPLVQSSKSNTRKAIEVDDPLGEEDPEKRDDEPSRRKI